MLQKITESMLAAVIERFSAPEVLKVETVPTPKLHEGEVLIACTQPASARGMLIYKEAGGPTGSHISRLCLEPTVQGPWPSQDRICAG